MNSLWKHPLPLHLFIDETIGFHLRISDIEKLNPGDQIEFICLDRNIWDLTDHNEENKVTSVTKFFEKGYQGTYIHQQGLQGTILFKDIDTEPQNFEFHIEWCKGSWYPLKNGKLKSDEQFNFPEQYENKSWDAYNSLTRIGWRGPMILKKWIKYLPKIYRMDVGNLYDEINMTLSLNT